MAPAPAAPATPAANRRPAGVPVGTNHGAVVGMGEMNGDERYSR